MTHTELLTRNLIKVGISEMAIATKREDALITFSLGSCAGIAIFDSVKWIGGMIHCMLPLSSNDPIKAKTNPIMFVDTGLTQLLQTLFNMGCEKKNLICKVAGCGSPMETHGQFKIGERNNIILRKMLWKNNILIKGEAVGGSNPKTLALDMSTGLTYIKMNSEDYEEL